MQSQNTFFSFEDNTIIQHAIEEFFLTTPKQPSIRHSNDPSNEDANLRQSSVISGSDVNSRTNAFGTQLVNALPCTHLCEISLVKIVFFLRIVKCLAVVLCQTVPTREINCTSGHLMSIDSENGQNLSKRSGRISLALCSVKTTVLCYRHFTDCSFVNKMAYDSGFAKK